MMMPLFPSCKFVLTCTLSVLQVKDMQHRILYEQSWNVGVKD